MGDTRPWDIFNPATEYVVDEVFNERYSICKACPKFIKTTSQCKECGCFMAVKAKIENAACPIQKW
jgi:hypothetical protein